MQWLMKTLIYKHIFLKFKIQENIGNSWVSRKHSSFNDKFYDKFQFSQNSNNNWTEFKYKRNYLYNFNDLSVY
jgi:hypothetical protein